MPPPGSQRQPTRKFRYAILPHAGGPLHAQRPAHEHNVGVQAFVTDKHEG